jgi:hypothetical protein
MRLGDYIKKHYRTNVAFAAATDSTNQHVGTQIRRGDIVIDGVQYSRRRELPVPPNQQRGVTQEERDALLGGE